MMNITVTEAPTTRAFKYADAYGPDVFRINVKYGESNILTVACPGDDVLEMIALGVRIIGLLREGIENAPDAPTDENKVGAEV